MTSDAGPGAARSVRLHLSCRLFVLLALLSWVCLCFALSSNSGEATGARHYLRAAKQVVALDAAADGPPSDNAAWQAVVLPDVVRRDLGAQDESSAGYSVGWYRIVWPGSAPAGRDRVDAADPLALYVPRTISGPLQVWLKTEQGWTRIFDNKAWSREQWNRPLLVTLPPQALSTAGALTLAVGMPYRNGRFRALSSLWVGPLSELRSRADTRALLQLGLPEAASLAMAALGVISLTVWFRRRHERAYLHFGVASLLWPLRNLHQFINLPEDPMVSEWFWWMTGASVSWVMLATYLFAFRFDVRRKPLLERGLVLFVLLGGLLTLPTWHSDALVLQHAVNLIVGLLVTVVLSTLAWRGGSRELRVIVVALWTSLAFAVHDWLLVAMLITPESVYLLPYGSMFVTGSFLYAAMRRFVGAVEQVEAANTVLAAALEDREQQLEANHLQLRRIERDQAVLIERQRLMREMHDGVGSTLITTLRVVEAGAYSREGVADLLRLAIEDLRLAIDSLEPMEHDLATLLATLRERVGRRLDGAGLQLKWVMDDLPALPWLDPTQALQILRLVQEALTNVIKHAHAKRVCIAASVIDASVWVRVSDDGIGFESSCATSGRGLPSMRLRALALGAQFSLDSVPGSGSTVSIRLPLQRHAGMP